MTDDPTRSQLLTDTEAAQARASDPRVSAWVSANAGAGKTHVLKLRVLRLLLAGTLPERILCLTYTKAAAAEMSQRVFAELAEWATADEADLSAIIAKLLAKKPTADDIKFARQLFARAIETPGGLKVQTIHAFCERLLQRFPLEADVPPGFAILDEETSAALQREAIDKTLTEANSEPSSALAHALQIAVARAADDRFDMALRGVLGNRGWLEGMMQLETTHDAMPFGAIEAYYRKVFAVRDGLTAAGLDAQLADVVATDQLAVVAVILAGGGKRDQQLAHRLRQAKDASNNTARIAALSEAFLTQAGAPRSDSQFVSKAVRSSEPGIADSLVNARDKFHELTSERLALETVEATVALLRLGMRVLEFYSAAKARRAALDFDDLIVQTAKLLGDSDAADWILYKLDGGLDHILVDEAQDTSPRQWTVIEALAAEFYSGEGASDVARTIFAVGDEKQSIYSFQGAAPERFARAGRRFADLANAVRRDWAAVPLTLSFRTVEPLLEAVDAVFADERRTPGVNVSGDNVRHVALRVGQAGCFEVWPTVVPEEHDPAPAFAPLDDASPGVPSQLLAEKIAERIQHWLGSGEILQSQARPLRASDFLILVRRRQPFAPEMVRALKARNIPVAGADRIVLTEQIAVQDLMALGDFLVLPEDDLALAAVLKSPLFDLDDDDLLRFAPERRGSLWSALLAAAKDDARLRPATDTLKRWRGASDFTPPYEFFASLLDRDGCRARLLGRLGPDAADPLDEFMNLALTYDEQAPASLQGFLSWLREGFRQIKRDMDHGREEVRVMTVHGAKGLEAPIVILPDTCSAPGGGPARPIVDLAGAEMPGQQEAPLAWAIKGARALAPISSGRAVSAQRELEEHNRLLYVALTRAKDRIYLTGFETKSGRKKGCWYDAVWSGLEDQLTEAKDLAGETVWRIESPQSVKPETAKTTEQELTLRSELPDWSRRRAPSEPQLVIPLAPSRLAPLETDNEGEPVALDTARDNANDDRPVEPGLASPRSGAADNRFLRGILTHSLLEHLPSYETSQRDEIAKKFVDVRGGSLGLRAQNSIIAEALAILDDPVFAPVFGPKSQAEVPIVAEIPRPSGHGPPLRLTGLIDRLAQTREGILIVDYKTNRQPPASPDLVAEVYMLQIAAYRLALKQIFPSKPIRAAFIWTEGSQLMPLPDNLLDDHQQRLWHLKTANLDAA